MLLSCLFILTTDGEESRFDMLKDFTCLVIIAELDGLLVENRICELYEEIKAVEPFELLKF